MIEQVAIIFYLSMAFGMLVAAIRKVQEAKELTVFMGTVAFVLCFLWPLFFIQVIFLRITEKTEK